MKRQRSIVPSLLSVLPCLVAAGLWYALADAASAAEAAYVQAPQARATPPDRFPGHWALNLLPAFTLLLPVLPIVVIGRELGRRHLEDYSSGIASLGATWCGVALLFGAVADTSHTPPGVLPGRAEQVGRAAIFAGTSVTAGVLVTGGVAAARCRRRERDRRRNWMCVSCGYNLRGNPWQCPECGRRYVPTGPLPGGE